MIRATGREAGIAWDYVLLALDGFESFWDERRWAMWRDPHQRLGTLVAMLFGILFWVGAAFHKPTLEAYAPVWIALGAFAYIVVWFGVAAFSRIQAKV